VTEGSGDAATGGSAERFNPWSVVHLVFDHLSAQGLHPVLGEIGDPSVPAGELLKALGIEPGDPSWARGQDPTQIQDQLAELRSLFDPVQGEGGR
jgi:hypothetical protein